MSCTSVNPKIPYAGQYWLVIAPVVRHFIKKRHGVGLARRAYKRGKPIYRAYIDRAPLIGAGNPMAKNFYMSAVFFAMWRACDGALSPDDMRQVVRDLFGAPIVKKALSNSEGFRSRKYRAELTEKLRANKRWADERPEIRDVTWDFNFDDDRGGEVVHYHYTRCPINDFCRSEGILEILPVMCEVDYLMIELGHGKLTRHHTLAQGGPCCDYLIEPER